MVMFKKKKKSNRLYYPTKSTWYRRPRRKSYAAVRKRNWFSFKGLFKTLKPSPFFMLISLILVAFISFLAFSSYFIVSDIKVLRKNLNINIAAIENELRPFIGKNFFLISKSRMTQMIQEKFPEFQNIEIQKVFPSVINVQVESFPIIANLSAFYTPPLPEKPSLTNLDQLNRAIEDLSNSDPDIADTLIKSPLQDEAASRKAFSLDEDVEVIPETIEQKGLLNQIGQVIFDQEENLELLTIVIKDLKEPLEDRQIAILPEKMNYIFESIQYFQAQTDTKILKIEYLPIAREVHLVTVDNLYLWIDTERPFRDQIDKFKLIYKPAELDKENLSYIDLRIKEKVIYCPKRAACDS